MKEDAEVLQKHRYARKFFICNFFGEGGGEKRRWKKKQKNINR